MRLLARVPRACRRMARTLSPARRICSACRYISSCRNTYRLRRGIGGGSSDAAATILALSDLVGDTRLPEGVAELGADVRVCLMRQAAPDARDWRGRRPLPPACRPCLPCWQIPEWTCRPLKSSKRWKTSRTRPCPNGSPQGMKAAAFIDWLATQRNDLEAPAIARSGIIQDVLDAWQPCPVHDWRGCRGPGRRVLRCSKPRTRRTPGRPRWQRRNLTGGSKLRNYRRAAGGSLREPRGLCPHA